MDRPHHDRLGIRLDGDDVRHRPAIVLRRAILLGIAEAGFFPGFVLYLTYWIPSADRARTGALFMMAAPVSIIVGAPVSEALLALDGRLGLHGWQWLFLVEGLPAVVLGILALRC